MITNGTWNSFLVSRVIRSNASSLGRVEDVVPVEGREPLLFPQDRASRPTPHTACLIDAVQQPRRGQGGRLGSSQAERACSHATLNSSRSLAVSYITLRDCASGRSQFAR